MRVTIYGNANKGITKRTPREEAALRCRILYGRHAQDAYQRVLDEMGDRGQELGPIDLTRNPLRAYVDLRSRAYYVPPLVTGLSQELAMVIGDSTAMSTVRRYATLGGRPLPSSVATVSHEVLRVRSACNWSGTLLGWADRSERPYASVVTPDDLLVEYASDEPFSPTRITHYRRRVLRGMEVEVDEVYDLSDLSDPSYRILYGDEDVTGEVLGESYSGDAYPWRYADGRPYHRIVISGDPREPYRGMELVEGTLGLAALGTHWRAGMRDAGWPQRWILGAEIVQQDTSMDTGQSGVSVGPESVIHIRPTDPDRPGLVGQWGPGFDPEVVGRALRDHEVAMLTSMGLPVSMEATGGEPLAREQEALEDAITSTYLDCRQHDVLVLRRMAAMCNARLETGFPERGYTVSYRQEIVAEPPAPVETDTDDTDEEGRDDGRS